MACGGGQQQAGNHTRRTGQRGQGIGKVQKRAGDQKLAGRKKHAECKREKRLESYSWEGIIDNMAECKWISIYTREV